MRKNTRKFTRKVVKSFVRKETIPLTVCIAAIYNNNSIIGVSDRMITFGDIQFEPPLPKILQFTTSIVALTAGDQNIQMQVYAKALDRVNERIKENPDVWLAVSEVAKIYSECYYNLKAELAEKDILFPYKLTTETFLQNKDQLPPEIVKRIASQFEEYEIDSDGIATIITGIDGTAELPQAHIFTIKNGVVSCADKIGYDAVGIGRYHALSHFMLSKYTRYLSEPKALSTIHLAKKKSEVSPGVGKETDMFVIGPQPGTFNLVIPSNGIDIVKSLDQFYSRYEKRTNKLDKGLETKIAEYLMSLRTPTTTPEQQTAPEPSPLPSASVSSSESTSSSPSASSSASKSSSKVKKKKTR